MSGERFSRSSLMGTRTEAQGLDSNVMMCERSGRKSCVGSSRAHSNGWSRERQTSRVKCAFGATIDDEDVPSHVGLWLPRCRRSSVLGDQSY